MDFGEKAVFYTVFLFLIVAVLLFANWCLDMTRNIVIMMVTLYVKHCLGILIMREWNVQERMIYGFQGLAGISLVLCKAF
jgi:hypothetical protein